MGQRRLALLILIACWTIPLAASFADDKPAPLEEKRSYTLTVGVREWLSQGRSAHNIGDSGANIRSELTWRGLTSPITEINADLVVQRFLMNLSIGYGTIGSGTLLDQDWNGNNRTQKTSETISQSDNGSVLIISLTPGLRVVQWTAPDNPVLGGVDALLGYQYWREKYAAYGIQDIFRDPSVFPVNRDTPASVNALTQTNQWHSLRLGARATMPAFSFLAFKANAFYIPVNYYRQEDIHHLRTDLQQNPSFLSTASGGNGVQVEGSVVVRVWRQLTAEAGYRYWDIKSGQGTVTQYNIDGTITQGQHNVDNTRRQGVFFGINWIF
jgi:outer membrane protease